MDIRPWYRTIFVLIFGILATAVITASSSATIPARACEVHSKPGDVIIGGIFPINRRVTSIPCDGATWNNFISLSESMTYAVDVINNRSDVLPNTILGYEVRNDCAIEDISLWTMMTMATPQGNGMYEDSCPNTTRGNSDQVLAVVGPSLSTTSLLAAKVGGVFSVPIVSYSATSDELSDYARFPFFYRTVPPDKFQVGAIMDLLQVYNWRYVALFYSIDTYGIHGARQITTSAQDMDICVAINRPVSSDASEEEITAIADLLIEHDNVSVIIMFSTRPSTLTVLRAVKESNISRKLTFIGSDGWGPGHHTIQEFQDILIGSMFTRFHRNPSPDFAAYYQELPNNTAKSASPWYIRKLDEIAIANGCVDWKSCRNITDEIRAEVPQPFYDTQVINAVFAVAYALDASIRVNCDSDVSCSEALDGAAIVNELANVSFYSESNDTFEFYSNGDPSGKYQISNWQLNDGEYNIVDVGLWDPNGDESRLDMDANLIQWGTTDGDVPTSLCVEDCQPGYIMIPLEMNCCFGCEKCQDFEIIQKNDDNVSVCVECPSTDWPDPYSFTMCLPIEPSYISPRSVVFVLSVVFASLGLIFTGISLAGLFYYSKHPLVKASSRDLSTINIIGLAFSCLVVFLTLLRPTKATCIITDICFTTSYCVVFTPMLLKVNRIWRLFNSATYLAKGKGKPRFTSPRDQVAIASGIILGEVIIACSFSAFASSTPELLFPGQRKQYLETYCQFGFGFLVSWLYNLIIIIACCYFAFRARKVPSNFNESKFIAISVYSVVMIGSLATVPVYVTANAVEQQIASLTVSLLLNTYLTLACLYVPKFYAIHFTEEQSWNIWKSHSTTRPAASDDNAMRSTTIMSKSKSMDSLRSSNTLDSVNTA